MTCGHCQRPIEECGLHATLPDIPCYGFRHEGGAHVCPASGVHVAEPPKNPLSF